MKVLVLFLFTGNPTMPYKTRGKLSFLFLKKKDDNNTKENSIPSEIGKNAMDKERKGKRNFLIQCT